MSNPEFESNLNENDGNLLEMAFIFDRVDYCEGGSKKEIQRAKDILTAQHRKVMPKFTRDKMHMLAQNESLINMISQTFHNAFLKDDLATSLRYLNNLHAFGNFDYLDSLGGKAFTASLEAHRTFAKRISDDFIDKSQLLSPYKESMLDEVAVYREQNEPSKELGKLRQLIHITALEGSLGEKAKQQFDPFAVIAIER
jgi:hypothetical protein